MINVLKINCGLLPITESVDMQSVAQSDAVCSDCFSLYVSIPLLDCWAKFLSDSEKLPPIVRPSLTCQITADHL